MSILCFNFGFCINLRSRKVFLPDIKWYNYRKTAYQISVIINQVSLACSKRLIPPSLFFSLPYYIWKDHIFPSMYYNTLLKSLTKHDRIKGNQRVNRHIGQSRNFLLYLSSALAVRAWNSIRVFLLGDFSLLYSIGSATRYSYLESESIKIDSQTTVCLSNFSWPVFVKSLFFNRRVLYLLPFTQFTHNNIVDSCVAYLEHLTYESLYFSRLFGPKLKRLLSDDDPSRIYGILHCCASLSVPTIGFQHGAYSINEFGYSTKDLFNTSSNDFWFDTLYVYNSSWSSILMHIRPTLTSHVVPIDNTPSSRPKTHAYPQCLESFTSIVLVLDNYADINLFMAIYDYILSDKPLSTVSIRPHPSMSSEEIKAIQNYILPSAPIATSLNRSSLYICVKSTFALYLSSNGFDLCIVPSELSYISDYFNA